MPSFKDIHDGRGQGSHGTLRENGVFPERALAKMPTALTFEEGATLPCAWLTAWNALFGLEERRDLKGKTVKPFKYSDKGTMATIGKSSAVAEITYLPKLTGFPAWIIWVALHIATLLGNRNRFATMINLSSKYLFSGSHNAIVGETPYVVSKHKVTITPLEKQQAERRVLERRAAYRSREKARQD